MCMLDLLLSPACSHSDAQDGGSLDKILKRGGRIPVDMIQRIAYAVCSGLRYLKENHGIIHRGERAVFQSVFMCECMTICYLCRCKTFQYSCEYQGRDKAL